VRRRCLGKLAVVATPSKQKTGAVGRARARPLGGKPTTSDVAWTRSSEAPTGSRPCGVQEQ
jgi:hypothetical protein